MSKALKKLSKKMETAQKKFVEEGRAAFTEAVAEIFTKHPKLNSFSWTQYTPYFNDGDTCVFSVHGVDEINGIDYWEGENDEMVEASGGLTEEESAVAVHAIEELLNLAPASVMQDVFGDHMEVTAHRDGRIEAEKHHHD